MAGVPEIRYARNGAVHLAYQSFGSGERHLILIPGFVSHLEFPWEHPPYRRFMQRLGELASVTVYDKRGSGLSDPVDRAAGFEQHLDDLAAVIAASGAQRPVLLGWSEGAAVAALYASHHPDSIESMVLYGAFPRMLNGPGYAHGLDPEFFEAGIRLIEDFWGDGVSLTILGSEKLEDEDFRRWWGRYERHASSPGAAIAALRIDSRLDFRDLLGAIHVPALLVHRVDDPIVSVAGAREMARTMPSARMVELPGTLHWPWIGDTDDLIEEIEEFLTGERRAAEPDRALATVLFTDIVGSTDRAAELGDRRWRGLISDHDGATGQEIARHGGRLVKSTGDGVLATFDRPAAAIRCAQALHEALGRLDLPIRAGLHTGEVELLPGDIGGIAVHIAARVNDLAGTRQTLVTRTVKDLVVGSDLGFEPTGTHTLRGIPGEWELYAVTGRSTPSAARAG